MPEPPQSEPLSYVVLLSGTHVTGKDVLAPALSTSLSCPWLKGEMCHAPATLAARSQARKGYGYSQVFGRVWFSKLQRIGFLSNRSESGRNPQAAAPRKLGTGCTAVITCWAMRKPARDAMREIMLANSIRPLFVVMQITKETLPGRTLGAEDPETYERVLGEKLADIEEPLEEEMAKDVIRIDSTLDPAYLFREITDGINKKLSGMQ